jgi:transposase
MKRIYVGIDWADDHHDVHVTDDSAAALDSFSIPHSYQGMERLRKRLSKFSSPEKTLVAIESHQGLLVYSLLESAYEVYPINPKAVNRYRDRYRMSSSKSDPKDAMVLANILRTDLHLYKSLPSETPIDARLRQLTRAHKSLVQQKVKLINQLTVQLKSYYPIALQIFSGLDQEITLAFLERYPTPQKAAAASLKELGEFFHERRYSHPYKVPRIYEALQQPTLKAPVNLEEVHQTIVLHLVPVLRALLAEIEKLAKEISREFKRNPAHDIFFSLPAGELTAARLNGELGSNGSRYPTREYVQTAAGTAPVTRRSGKTIVVYFRWQCNKQLRGALQDLARESVKRCVWAKEYFVRQMKLGHKASRAYRALANRWAAIIWRMLQERQRFDQSRLGKSCTTALPVAQISTLKFCSTPSSQ